jgi:ABC-2 type transport system ATP-binding protein
VVASGTAAELKAQVGKRAVHVTLTSPQDVPAAIGSLEKHGLAPVFDEPRTELRTPVDASADLAVVVRALDEVHVEVAELALTEPSLDDVYLTLAKNKAA